MADASVDSLKRRIRHASPTPVPNSEELPEAAVAIIIDPEIRDGAVLLIQRRERQGDPWSGQVAFPGGHKSPTDRSFLDTAIREASEEVGIDLREHEVIGSLPQVHSLSRRVIVAPYVFQLRSKASVRPNQEVAEGFWVALKDLVTMTVKKIEVSAGNGRLTVNSYVVEDHVIWGLTYRILNILIDRPEPADP